MGSFNTSSLKLAHVNIRSCIKEMKISFLKIMIVASSLSMELGLKVNLNLIFRITSLRAMIVREDKEEMLLSLCEIVLISVLLTPAPRLTPTMRPLLSS